MKQITDHDIEYVARALARTRFGDDDGWRSLAREACNMIAAYRSCEEIDHPESGPTPVDEPQQPYKVHE